MSTSWGFPACEIRLFFMAVLSEAAWLLCSSQPWGWLPWFLRKGTQMLPVFPNQGLSSWIKITQDPNSFHSQTLLCVDQCKAWVLPCSFLGTAYQCTLTSCTDTMWARATRRRQVRLGTSEPSPCYLEMMNLSRNIHSISVEEPS